jgi:hypothetical protein
MRIDPGRVLLIEGADDGAQLRIRAASSDLLAITAAPLRLGLPDPFAAEGRAVLGAIVSGRMRIRGMIGHPRRLVRLTELLSAR